MESHVSRITLPILDAVTLTAACTQIVADARAAFDRLATLPLDEVSPSTVLDEWDRIGLLVENIEGPDLDPQQRAPGQGRPRRGRRGDSPAGLVSGRGLPERGALRPRAGRGAVHARRDAAAQGPGRVVRRHRRDAATRSPRARQGDRRAHHGALPGVLAQPARQPVADDVHRRRDARAARAVPVAPAARRAGALPAVVRLPRLQPVHGQRRRRGRAAALLRRVPQSRQRPETSRSSTR